MAIQAAASTDFAALERLRGAASKSTPSAAREAASQFEALLLQSMLKSMRAVSFGGGLFDSEASGTYRDILDQQLALEMSHGKGIGLADVIERQLGGAQGAPSEPARQVTLSARIEKPKARPFATTAADFVQQLLPHARAAAHKLGVSAKALLAQAALETGWGQRSPSRADGTPSNNLFGIKAGSSWQGDSVNVATLEYDGDIAQRVQARFRAYSSPGASFEDFASLIAGNPRYAEALARGEDVAGFAQALQDAGYATDPDYARKIDEVAQGEQMRAALAGLIE